MPVRKFRLSLAMGPAASIICASFAGVAFAQTQADPGASTEEIVVTAKRLDTARDAIAPSLGASD